MAMSGALTYGEVKGFWIAAGGPASAASEAAAIAMAESGLEPGIIQQSKDYANTGWGLWQHTPGNSYPTYGTDYQMLDPWNNAEVAVIKYQAGGNSFYYWTNFGDDGWQNYLNAAEAATPVSMADPGQFVSIGSAPTGTHNASSPGAKYGPAMPSPIATSTPGWFRQGDGSFHLLRTNTAGAASVPFVAASTGSGIYPIAGDWQGTGTITPGWFRQSDGSFHLLKSNTAGADTIAFVGAPTGDANVLPLAGDWSGSGITRVGWYRRTDGTFHLLESNAAGSGTNAFVGGPVGDNSVYPLAGDWNGNGVTEVGWFRQSDGTFHLLPNNAPGTSTNAFTAAPTGSGIYPLAGDWTAEGFAKAGWFRQADGSYHLLKSNANNADTIPFVAAPTGDSGVYPLAPAKRFWSI